MPPKVMIDEGHPILGGAGNFDSRESIEEHAEDTINSSSIKSEN